MGNPPGPELYRDDDGVAFRDGSDVVLWKNDGAIERHSIDKMALWGRGEEIGEPVHAGVSVGQQEALRVTTVWRCIRLISETLAGLPAEVIRKQGDVRLQVERLPRWLEMPNPETTWFQFAERVFESQCMDGNAFILVTARDAMGFPSELFTLYPRSIDVRKRDNGDTYYVWEGDTELSRLTPVNPFGDVLHIPLAGAGGARGMSPIQQARQGIGLALVTEKFGARFFGKGTTMSGVIELPAPAEGGVTKSKEYIDLMRATWEETHAGADKAHRPGVLTGGARWRNMTISPEDAQFLQTREFQVEEICRLYGVPPVWVGSTDKQTSWGTGVAEQSIGLYRYTLRGYMTRFESAMSWLLPRGQFLRLNPKALLEGDAKAETDVLQTALQNGVINFDTWRAKLDLPPRPGGSRYMVPSNMKVLEPNGVPAAAPPMLAGPPEPDQEEESDDEGTTPS